MGIGKNIALTGVLALAGDSTVENPTPAADAAVENPKPAGPPVPESQGTKYVGTNCWVPPMDLITPFFKTVQNNLATLFDETGETAQRERVDCIMRQYSDFCTQVQVWAFDRPYVDQQLKYLRETLEKNDIMSVEVLTQALLANFSSSNPEIARNAEDGLSEQPFFSQLQKSPEKTEKMRVNAIDVLRQVEARIHSQAQAVSGVVDRIKNVAAAAVALLALEPKGSGHAPREKHKQDLNALQDDFVKLEPAIQKIALHEVGTWVKELEKQKDPVSVNMGSHLAAICDQLQSAVKAAKSK